MDLYLYSPACFHGPHGDFNFIGSKVTYYAVRVLPNLFFRVRGAIYKV